VTRSRGRRPRDRGQGESGRERILQAAIELISEQGFAATGVAQVCERAGVAKTALYWHFESKEGLLATVVERVGTSWIEEIQKRSYQEGEPLQRIQRVVQEWRRILLEQPQLIRLPMIVQLEQGETSENTRAALQRVYQRAERALIQGIEDSLGIELPDLDLVAHTIVTLLQGAMLRQILDPDEAVLDRILGELRRTIVLLIADRLPDEMKARIESLPG